MKTLKIKNYFLVDTPEPNKIQSLQVWLNEQMLHGSASRHRTRFIKLILSRAEEIDKEKFAMLEKYADKKKVKGEDKVLYLNDKGKDTIDSKEGKSFKLNAEKLKVFSEEYSKYLGEEFVIDVTPANRETIYGVRELLLNTNAEFSKIQATRYNEWCLSFEEISESK